MLFRAEGELAGAAAEVAKAGAAELERFWRRLGTDQVEEKARNDLVTDADRASEAAILDGIRRRFPDHRILSEESGWSGADTDGPTWIVDPLDGTTNFVHGLPQFAVSVAVADRGELVAGVVLDPLRGDLFQAARGGGAWWNEQRCEVSRRPGLSGALIATGFPFRAHQLIDPYLAIFREVFLGCKAIRRPGAAALDLAWVAAGVFDGFFEFKLSAWDVAAGALLVREAGGVVTDMDGGDRVLATGNVLCGGSGVHRDLLAVVQRHGDSWHALAEG